MITYRDFPQQLKDTPNWVCWKSIVRDGKATKVPFNAKTGQTAKADDPTTWASFDQAVEAADILNDGDYDGIGFQFLGTNFAGIDFDSAITSDGVIDPYALAILKLLGNPYTELSPSGTGLHAFVECDALPKGKREITKDHNGIGVYHGQEKGRFFTVTGTWALGDKIPKIADISLPYMLITQTQDKKFKALWLGDTSGQLGDDSSADFALMCNLARLTKNDPVKMEKFFSASALGQRDKWKDRKDYRERTVKAALDGKEPIGTGASAPSADIEFHTPAVPDPDGDYVVAPASGQEDGWFPLGDISLIGGASGTGKTTWIFDTLHKQKQGWPVLEHRTNKYSFHVLAYDRGRNAFTRTLRRLQLLPTDIPTTALELAFGTAAVQGIINQIESMNPTPNVIFIEGLDMLLDDANKKSVVSPFMRQLQKVAAHFHIALVCSVGAPKSKRGEDYAAKRDKISGSEAWGRNCETVCVLEFSADDDGTAPQRELTILPRNAPAEKFTLQFEGGRLVLVQPTAEVEPESEANPVGRPSIELQKAITFLEKELHDGSEKISVDLFQKSKDIEDIGRHSMDKAAKILHVVKRDYQDVTLPRKPWRQMWSIPPMHEVGGAVKAGSQSSLIDYGGAQEGQSAEA